MSGYKRVNFYELCRLCATNQQKDHKTHIFQEEGRKIQLQTKIQSCLSLTVCENDFLPKVVCSKCLRTLEVCYTFRQECVSSETMLSSYFKNFRYTEDFKKSGKVYIKDTGNTSNISKSQSEPVSVPSTAPIIGYSGERTLHDVPFYAVQLPAIVTNNTSIENKVKNEQKIHFTQKSVQHKQENLSNVVVNANGEVLNIAQLVDFDNLINQNANINNNNNNKKKKKREEEQQQQQQQNLIKIDLTNSSELDHFEQKTNTNTNTKKFAYALKVEDKQINNPQSVIFNSLDFNNTNNNQTNFNYYNGTNATTTTTTVETSTVNLNQLNQELQFPNPPRTFPPQTITTTKEEPIIIKVHTCEICQKSFKRREHLYQHVKLHTGFRPYTCESCNKSFMRKEHLLRHMTSHSGQKNFTCNICDKSFSRNDNLLKHKKTHDKQTSYQCDVCQKQFVMKHYYLAHKLTHDSIGGLGGGDERCATAGNGPGGGNSNSNNNNNSLGNVWNVLKT